jgi:hypothetical protein
VVKKSRYTEEQIAFALKQVELGTPELDKSRKPVIRLTDSNGGEFDV